MSSLPAFGGQGELMQLMIGLPTPPEASAKRVVQLPGDANPDGPELAQVALEALTRLEQPESKVS